MKNKVRSWWWMLAGVAAFVLGTFALAYGWAMTFMVPGEMGESFFSRNRLLLGPAPLLLGIAILGAAGLCVRRALRSSESVDGPSLAVTVGYCVFGSIAAIFLFAVVGSFIYQR